MSNMNSLSTLKNQAAIQLALIIKHGGCDEHNNQKALKFDNQNFNAPTLDSGREIALIAESVVVDSNGHEYNHSVLFDNENIELTLTMIDELDAWMRESGNNDYKQDIPFVLGGTYLFEDIENSPFCDNLDSFGEELIGKEILQVENENDCCFTFILDSATTEGYLYRLINVV